MALITKNFCKDAERAFASSLSKNKKAHVAKINDRPIMRVKKAQIIKNEASMNLV